MRYEHLRSLRSSFHRVGASRAVMFLAALAALPVVGAGCGSSAKPRPAAVAEVPSPRAEPYLVLDLSDRRVYYINESGSRVKGYPVAIGRPKWPTPTGRFRINEMVRNPDFVAFDFNDTKSKDKGRIPPGPNNPLGLRWIGFAHEYGWAIGFHGTQKTSVLGQAVSHGCVRMSNNDVVELFDRVKLGTTVVVEP